MHRGARRSPRPRVGRAGPGRTFRARAPAPSRLGAAGRAGALLRGRTRPGGVTSRHRGSPGRAMRRMSAWSPGGGTLPARAAAAAAATAAAATQRSMRAGQATPRPAPAPPQAARKARSPRQRDYRRRVLFILSRVPGNSAGRLPGTPPWGGGREREERGWTSAPGAPRGEGVLRHWGGVTDPSKGTLLRKYRPFPGQEWLKFSCPRGD